MHSEYEDMLARTVPDGHDEDHAGLKRFAHLLEAALLLEDWGGGIAVVVL